LRDGFARGYWTKGQKWVDVPIGEVTAQFSKHGSAVAENVRLSFLEGSSIPAADSLG